jgi:hypothetical protein
MTKSAKFFVVIGCLFILIAVVLKVLGFWNIVLLRTIKPSTFLIAANTSFLLALLLKK